MKKSRLIGVTCASVVALCTSLSANAAFIILGGTSQPLPVSGNDFNVDLQNLGYSIMYTDAQLSVNETGFVTYTYIGAESGFNNIFNTPSGSMAEADEAFNINGYNSITVSASVGDVLDFSFTSDGGSNALSPVDNLSGTNLQGLGIFTPSGGGDFNAVVLGYDDQSIFNDDNHDDMLVLVEYSPIPVPPALWLFGSGILGLVGIARKKKTA